MERVLRTPLLLVALPYLQDPNFQKAVVLLIEHNEDGAMGFVVNRPSKLPVSELITMNEIDIPKNIPAWFGGPVGTDNGLVLHNQKGDNSDFSISHDVNISSSDFAIQGLVQHAKISKTHDPEPIPAEIDAIEVHQDSEQDYLYPYRFIVGYSGWGPKQLDEELKMGTWLELPMSIDLLFNTPWQSMWESCISVIGADPSNFAPATQYYLN